MNNTKGYIIVDAAINPDTNNSIAIIVDKKQSISNTSKKLCLNDNTKNIKKNENNTRFPNKKLFAVDSPIPITRSNKFVELSMNEVSYIAILNPHLY